MANDPKKPGIAARVAQAAQYVIANVTPSTWMSPLQPLAPIAPPEVKGRQFDYPVGVNTRYVPRATELVGFPKLRALAENCGILRTVIERQKDLIEAFDWQIKPREETPGKRPGETRYKTEIEEITQFLQRPDNVLDWGQWLRAVLEDLFVIDAVAIYRRPTLDGTRLWGLERMDGAQFQVLVDGTGRTPQPPSPAYVQIDKGVPAGDFTIEELIYFPRSPRTHKLYGMSPVQQIIDEIETQIQRIKSQKAYFTQGNLTDGMFSGPAEWSIDQIKTWQTYWDDQFLGNVEARRHGMWVPAGTKFEQIKQPPLKDEFDEWLARVICFAFSTSPQPFIKQVSRGNQESQQEVAEEGGVASCMVYVKRLMDKIIRDDLLHPELEFSWSNDKEFDPMVAAQINDIGLRNGSKVLNEVRDQNGDDPYPPEIGDVPMIVTATGAVSVEQALAPPPPPPTHVMAPGDAGGAGGGGLGNPPPPAAGDPPKPAPTPAPKPADPPKPLKKGERPSAELDTPAMKAARLKAKKVIAANLKKVGAGVRHQVTHALLLLNKATGEPDDDAAATSVAAGLDLTGLDDMVDGMDDILTDIAQAAGVLTLVQVGLADEDKLTNQVGLSAMAWARERAAELVGKRWTAEGDLIDNPNAEWAISDSTRNMVQKAIADGLRDNLSVPEIADSLVGAGEAAYPFSEDRAALIAETEVNRANSQGALAGAREAQDAGVDIKKVWLGGQDPCEEVCQPNIDQGAIEIDEDFESGDDAPPGHPGCFCSVSWEVGDAAEKRAPRRSRFVAMAA